MEALGWLLNGQLCPRPGQPEHPHTPAPSHSLLRCRRSQQLPCKIDPELKHFSAQHTEPRPDPRRRARSRDLARPHHGPGRVHTASAGRPAHGEEGQDGEHTEGDPRSKGKESRCHQLPRKPVMTHETLTSSTFLTSGREFLMNVILPSLNS